MNMRETHQKTLATGDEQPHESARLHAGGRAIYTDDIPETEGTLYAAIGYSTVASGIVTSMDFTEVLACEGVVRILTAKDIPGSNQLGIVVHDEPLLAEVTVQYWGQPLFLVLATGVEAARKATLRAKISYQAHEPVLDPFVAKKAGHSVTPTRVVSRGNMADALKHAAIVCDGNIEIGGQEHFYLEGQVAYAVPGEDNRLIVHSATQHPSEMQQMVAQVLGWASARVTVLCRRMGGAFGGKESQSYIFTCLAALAAALTQRPVKLRADRDDDFLITGKRHEFWIRYQLAAAADGLIDAASFDHLIRCGYSCDYSDAVADRAVFHATNAYYVPNFYCESFRAKTNTQSATAFRGFGGPQGILGMEIAIEALALKLNMDPLDVRLRNLYGEGERTETHYGFHIEDNVLPELVTQLELTSEYRRRRAEIIAFNTVHRVLKRGIALMPVLFGVGFGATFLNQAGALIQVYADGSVIVNHGGTEMGQGLNTKLSQVVANELGLPADCVFCSSTDTSKVPNTVSTAASSGTDLNGMAALNAAKKLRSRLAQVAASHWNCDASEISFSGGKVHFRTRWLTFADLCAKAFIAQVSLSATGFYRTPKVAYDFTSFKGRPFLYYTYGAACSEVTIDTFTGELKVDRVDILQDAGRMINPALDRGQVEGGFVQGMGWMTSEELVWRSDGFLATHAPQTYKIPTSRDTPTNFNVSFFANENKEDTIHRSKAIGEPPLKLALSVYLAVWDAVASVGGRLKAPQLRVPATPECILRAIKDVGS